MKHLAAILAFCLGCLAAVAMGQGTVCGPGGCSPFQGGAPQFQNQPTAAAPPASVVRIVNTSGRVTIYGSGTVIGPTLVISCSHLFNEGVGQVQVRYPDGTNVSASVIKLDVKYDLSAISIPETSVTPVIIAGNYPQQGEQVRSCGYGPNGQYACNSGQVLGYLSTRGSQTNETMEISGSARMGDSGGPVFNQSGELAGVLWGSDGRVVEASFCGRVKSFLGDLLNRKPKDPPLADIPPKPTDSNPRVSPLDDIAQAGGTALIMKILVGAGIASGPAGLIASALAWFGVRKIKKDISAIGGMIQSRISAQPPASVPQPTQAPSPRPDHSAGGAYDPAFDIPPAASPVVVRKNRAVPVETDFLDKAWADAVAILMDQRPAWNGILQEVQSLRDQILAGKLPALNAQGDLNGRFHATNTN